MGWVDVNIYYSKAVSKAINEIYDLKFPVHLDH